MYVTGHLSRPRTHHGVVVRPWNQKDCQCGCHRERFDGETYGPFPKAEEHGLCRSCADEAFQAWATTLEAISYTRKGKA